MIVLGVGPIKPWGYIQKWFFKVTTRDELEARLGLIPRFLFDKDERNSDKKETDTTTVNDKINEMVLEIDNLSTTTANNQDSEIIKKQLDGILALLKHYIVNIPQLKKE